MTRRIMDLEPGDQIEHMLLRHTVRGVETIPEADPSVEGVTSPLVADNEVWLTVEGADPFRADGTREVAVTGCEACGDRHKPENCRRRSA